MAQAFYRTYRPQTFSDLYGQKHVKETISNAIIDSAFSHAYLFSGPRGVGKTTLARVIAKSLNCKKRKKDQADPCNECESCDAINSGAVDVIEIDAASNRGIDEIRSLREKARTSPLMLSYKVFIIDEVHMLTKEAFDALLKTLEEPRKHALFILATTEFEKIPKTIISRCQTFELKTIPFDELLEYLKKIVTHEELAIEEDVLKYIVAYSGGYARDATSLLNQVSILKEPTLDHVKELFGVPVSLDVEKVIEALADGSVAAAFEVVRKIVIDGGDVAHFSRLLQEYVRILLLIDYVDVAAYSYDIPVDGETHERLVEISKQFDTAKLSLFLKNLIQYEERLKDSYHPELFIEIAIIETFGEMKNARSVQKTAPAAIHEVQKATQSAYEAPSQHSEVPAQESPSVPVKEKALPQDPIQEKPVIQNKVVKNVSKSSQKAAPVSTDDELNAYVSSFSTTIGDVEKTVQAPVKEAPQNIEPEELSEKEELTTTKTKTIATSLDAIQQRWNDIILAAARENASLGGMLKSTCILGIKNGTLVLVADFDFHQNIVNDPKNKEIVERILNGLFQEAISVTCELSSSISTEDRQVIDKIKQKAATKDRSQREDSYNAAIEVFGAKPNS